MSASGPGDAVGPGAAPGTGGDPGAALFGHPSAAELVAAVREFLEQDVMAATEGRVRFHARVAANALAMVERELELGPALTVEHAAGLAELGVASEVELAAAIRSGRFDGRQPELIAVLRRSTEARLRIANPGYADG